MVDVGVTYVVDIVGIANVSINVHATGNVDGVIVVMYNSNVGVDMCVGSDVGIACCVGCYVHTL